jgi:bifunctional non-homologous end joining protein LigD
MSLRKYIKKRNFNITKEPSPKKLKPVQQNAPEKLYVIQKHAASHLHYDLRLEMQGVLKSWAVPKGPSLDPKVKHLAIEVEDHPIEYGTFEGTIPKGEYGGGTVILWDKGSWECHGNFNASYKKGDITFEIKGIKLQGLWKLIRIKSKNGDKKTNWLFFKLKDKYAETDHDILEKMPNSILGKKSKFKNKTTAQEKIKKTESKKIEHQVITQIKPASLPNTKKRVMPSFIKPQLATLAETTPLNDEWLHEIKFDGYRIIAIKKHQSIKLFTRNGLDWTHKFPKVAKNLKSFPIKNAIFDGELVALDSKGISSFQVLQNSIKEKTNSAIIQYNIFDLPYCNDYDLTKTPLIRRKELLKFLFEEWSNEHEDILYSEHVQGHGPSTFKKACQYSLEGIISKHFNSIYESKRSKSWVKSKCSHRQEFVIAGFTDPAGSRKYFGSLILGVYDKNKRFIYCGHVGTGFNGKIADRTLIHPST